MLIRLTADDLEFLQRAEALGREGLSQEEIAERLQLTTSTFRYRIHNLGFEFVRRTELATKPTFGGRTLSELLASGDLVTDAAEASAA
jgi:hypothetical protein